MSLWGVILGRLIKHASHHLIIPLIGGIAVEFAVHLWVPDDSAIVILLGVFLFRTLILIFGVCASWLLVMFLLIRHETKKKIDLRNLKRLEKSLDRATAYYGVSIIPLTEWFDPGSQAYLTKLLRRKLETDEFQHDRTLLFFSPRELDNTRINLTDESRCAKVLAFMHGDFDIPLSFLERKEIFDILNSEELLENDRAQLGIYPRWTRWFLSKKMQGRHWLPRRIPQLDFGLVTPEKGAPYVLRICKSENQLRIQEELTDEKAKPYIKFANLIRAKVYDEDQRNVRPEHDFLAGFNARPKRRPRKDPRSVRIEQLAASRDVKFRIRKYVRFVDIAEKSGDISVREEFEGISTYPSGSIQEAFPRTITSKFGYLRKPRFSKVEGAQVEWEWATDSTAPGEKKGVIRFDPPIENEVVNFVMERRTLNGIHFNQRDRCGPSEEVSGQIENLHDFYVLKVKFPNKNFPTQFVIHVTDQNGKRDYQEEKTTLTRFARFAYDSTGVLIIERPLPGYVYRVMWNLPKDDVDQLQLSRQEARIVREAHRRLLALSEDNDRATLVSQLLHELENQIATARIFPDATSDATLEVALHVYNEEQEALISVALSSDGQNPVRIGESTVGQAYKRRAVVSWTAFPDSNDSEFWDYGVGHTGIVSIPLFFPLQTTVGGRVCVLSIATKSANSGLLYVIDRFDDVEMLRAFTQHVNAWYAKSLAPAIGLPDFSKETLNRPQTE